MTLKVLLVTGSRSIKDYKFVSECLDSIYKDFKFTAIMEGEAGENEDPDKRKISVDLLAKRYAIEHNIEVIPVKAKWYKYGNIAGILRNVKMVKKLGIKDRGIAIWDGKSPGTKQCLTEISQAGKLLKVFIPNLEGFL